MTNEELALKIREAANLLDEVRRASTCPNSVFADLSTIATKLDSLSMQVMFPKAA